MLLLLLLVAAAVGMLEVETAREGISLTLKGRGIIEPVPLSCEIMSDWIPVFWSDMLLDTDEL